jgi:LemA protein
MASIMIISVFALLIVATALYNSVVNRKNQVDEAFGGVDVQLKRRYDLIPQAIEAVGRYTDHERSLMESLTKWRSEAGRFAVGSPERESLERNIGMGLKALLAVAENYPDLKASGNFLHLQGTLNEIEDNIQAARRYYNAAVKQYNNACEMIPYSIAASMQGMERKEMFKATEAERSPVSVRELFDKRSQ